MKVKRIQVRLDNDRYELLKHLSVQENRSISSCIRICLDTFLLILVENNKEGVMNLARRLKKEQSIKENKKVKTL